MAPRQHVRHMKRGREGKCFLSGANMPKSIEQGTTNTHFHCQIVGNVSLWHQGEICYHRTCNKVKCPFQTYFSLCHWINLIFTFGMVPITSHCTANCNVLFWTTFPFLYSLTYLLKHTALLQPSTVFFFFHLKEELCHLSDGAVFSHSISI